MTNTNITKRVLAALLAIFVLLNNNVVNVLAGGSSNTEEPEVTQNKEEEVVELRDRYSNTYLNEDGSYTTFFYASPIRYEDKNGELVDIDTSIKTVNKGEGYKYSSTATEVEVSLPELVSKETPILLSYGKYQVTLYPITEDSVRSDRDNPEEKVTVESLKSASKSSAKVNKETVTDIYGNKAEKNTKLSYDAYTDKKTKQSSKVNAIEIEYYPENEGIKENIVINER